MQVQVLAGGNHFSGVWGRTIDEIRRDRFPVSGQAPAAPGGDTGLEVALAMGRGLGRVAKQLNRLKPDILVLLGDRYETLAAAAAATLLRIPVAHLHGGETTAGAFDNQMRNAISQLSELHFVSHPLYRKNLIRMGVPPRDITVTGALFSENLRAGKKNTPKRLRQALGFSMDKMTFLVAWHPETMQPEAGPRHLVELCAALHRAPSGRFILLQPNADPGHQMIRRAFRKLHQLDPEKFPVFDSLGTELFHACLSQVHAIVGNSSSGILEAPSFGAFTINLGSRQKGRFHPPSVTSCAVRRKAILKALGKVMRKKRRPSLPNPFVRPRCSETIVRTLRQTLDGQRKVRFL